MLLKTPSDNSDSNRFLFSIIFFVWGAVNKRRIFPISDILPPPRLSHLKWSPLSRHVKLVARKPHAALLLVQYGPRQYY